MSYLRPYADETEEFSEQNYFVRHWRGHLSLPVSYWVNGGILFAATAWVGNLILMAIGGSSSLRAVATASVILIVLLLLMRVWSLVGIWRSAKRHTSRGGSGFWAGVAQVMVALGVVTMVAQLNNVFLQVREFGYLAAGTDPIGEPAALSLSEDGRELLVEGYLAQGTAGDFRRLVAGAPRLERILLSSLGGRVHEAELMARLVRERRLATHVLDQCVSACTMVLLAGDARTAAPGSGIGFHRVAFPGLTRAEDEAANAEMSRSYAAAGLPPYFLRRINRTPAEEVWFPTLAELVDAEVLTDAGPQRDAYLAEAASQLQKGLPRRLDEVTLLQRVVAEGEALTYRYRIEAPAAAVDRARLQRELSRSLTDEACRDEAMIELLAVGGRARFVYTARNGATVADIVVSRCDGPNRFRLSRT